MPQNLHVTLGPHTFAAAGDLVIDEAFLQLFLYWLDAAGGSVVAADRLSRITTGLRLQNDALAAFVAAVQPSTT